jgi:hypothetical protein
MPATTEPPRRDRPGETWRRLGWFVLLYFGGLAAVTLLAYGLRLLWPFQA